MIVDHVGGEASWLYVLTGGTASIVPRPRASCFLSGFSMGMVHHVIIRTKGIRAMIGKSSAARGSLHPDRRADDRVRWRYPTRRRSVRRATDAGERGKWTSRVVITFHRTYSLTDILVLYTLLILMAGPLLWLIAPATRWRARGVRYPWVVFQLWPERIPRAWQITDAWLSVLSWQLIFVTGLVVDTTRTARAISENRARWRVRRRLRARARAVQLITKR